MSLKSLFTSSKPSVATPAPVEFATQWTEARQAYPLYAALASQFNLAPLPHPLGELPPVRPPRETFDADLKWLEDVDAKVMAYQIRQLPSEILNASDETLRAVLHRQLRKQKKTPPDRDKIDLLLVQYFALCAPEDLYRKEIRLEDAAQVLEPVLGHTDVSRVEWAGPLDKILAKVADCESLRDMMEHGLLEQGRLLKESVGDAFYQPAALVAFCRFNFLLRRAFIRMLHADLSAVRHAVEILDAGGVKTVDCRRAGFSAAETTIQLRYYCENWKQPFHKDYTETSVSRAFEQLLALRADLEEAVARVQSTGAPAKNAAETKSAEVKQARESTTTQNVAPQTKAVPPAAAVQVSPSSKRSGSCSHCEQFFRATCGRERFPRNDQVPGDDLGTIDRGAAFARALDVHGGAARYESVTVFVGSGGLRRQRQPGSGRPAPRRGSARAAGGGDGSAQTLGRFEWARFSVDPCKGRSVVLPGSRRDRQAREEHRSRGQLGDQHEAAAVVHRRSRKTSAVKQAELGSLS